MNRSLGPAAGPKISKEKGIIMAKPLYIVGADGSEWSERAVRVAVGLAKQTGAGILLFHVLQVPHVPFLSDDGAYVAKEGRYDPPRGGAEAVKAAEEKILKPLVDEFSDSGVEIETGHAWGDPRKVLHQLIKERHARMIFMGRRGRTTFGDLILGSVANGLAHHAGVPVVLVP